MPWWWRDRWGRTPRGSGNRRAPLFVPGLEGLAGSMIGLAAGFGHNAVGRGGSLLKVFFPYLVWDTVFDNTRVAAELGRQPERFSTYAYGLLRFSREQQFRFPYLEWPQEAGVLFP